MSSTGERRRGRFAALSWARRLAGAAVLAAFFMLFLGGAMGIEWSAARLAVPLAKFQFMPALLAGNALAAGATVVLTLLMGRLYCGVACPLGLLQDVAARVGAFARWAVRIRPKPGEPAERWPRARAACRCLALVAFVALGACGFGFVWLEPYGMFGRMFVVGAGMAFGAVVLLLAAACCGRVWCSWACPVGTTLGAMSKVAPVRLAIDGARCVGCRKCERVCGAGAVEIDERGGRIDRSLCIYCFRCGAECPTGAISLGLAKRARKEERE